MHVNVPTVLVALGLLCGAVPVGAEPMPSVEARADATLPAAKAVAGTGDIYASLKCRDRQGHDVSLVKVANLGDIGRAWYINRVPIIAMDPHVADRLPDKLVRFFYDHECAHHVLGHWFLFSPHRESDADCWAITRARDAGRLSREDVVSFAPFLAASPGSPFGHLPGPERAQHLLFCFDKPIGG